jgi:hypothetical protein
LRNAFLPAFSFLFAKQRYNSMGNNWKVGEVEVTYCL